jgi:ferredoxin/ribosomal protein L36
MADNLSGALRFGPTFDEMLHPDRMPAGRRDAALQAKARGDELNPDLLWDITWRGPAGHVRARVLPKALTGIDADIVLLHGHGFPTGSHKVGATYSCALEAQLAGTIRPGAHTLVWPSTGNYGIGGAWVGPRLGYRSVVILPEEMSQERFDRIERYGAQVQKTPGCESNVKEILDACKVIAQRGEVRVLNQFEQLANYRFHWHVTGNSAAAAVAELAAQGLCGARVAAFVSAMRDAAAQDVASFVGPPDTWRATLRHHAERAAADPRYGAAKSAVPPRLLPCSLQSYDCTDCHKCVPVCPNDANFALPVAPRTLTVGQVELLGQAEWSVRDEGPWTIASERQYANFADACNDCGNCDVSVPSAGRRTA